MPRGTRWDFGGILAGTPRYIERRNCSEARLAGFEPATHGLEVRCSIQLSYRRTSLIDSRGAGDRGLRGLQRPQRAGDGIRTRDNQLGRLALYQLSYTRLLTPAPRPEPYRDERIRTSDPLLPKQVRYQAAPRPVGRTTPASAARVYRTGPLTSDLRAVCALHLHRRIEAKEGL
jgi:hypothetical protein